MRWNPKAAGDRHGAAGTNGRLFETDPVPGQRKDTPLMTKTIDGTCHCGNLKATLTTDKEPQDMWMRACQCDFCRSHNMRSLADCDGRLAISVADEAQLNRYHFGLNTVDFLICKNCGNYIGAVQRIDDELFGILNANLTENKGKQFGDAAHAVFEEETGDERNARRKSVWTPATLKIA